MCQFTSLLTEHFDFQLWATVKVDYFGLQARLKSLQCAKSAALRRGDTEAAKRVNQSMSCTFVVLLSMQVPTKHCARFSFLCYHPLL